MTALLIASGFQRQVHSSMETGYGVLVRRFRSFLTRAKAPSGLSIGATKSSVGMSTDLSEFPSAERVHEIRPRGRAGVGRETRKSRYMVKESISGGTKQSHHEGTP